MRVTSGLVLWAGLLAANVFAGSISFEASRLPSGTSGATSEERLFRYSYFVNDITFAANQELDIQFDPALYGGLFNGLAGAGFLVTLLQPNNPPGFFGDYSVLALSADASLAGPFRVDFSFLGTGLPGAQPFLINEYDASGRFLRTMESGVTTPSGSTAVPEPGGLSTCAICGLVLLMGGGWWAVRRRSGGTA
jgi:hypothetical protein